MSDTPNLVFFTFAGREENMRIQRPHVEALLDMYPEAEFHLWDMTRRASDAEYLREWNDSHGQIRLYTELHPGHPFKCYGPRRRGHRPCSCPVHKPPFEQPYRLYRDSQRDYTDDAVFVKFDDDVLWMDTPRFPEMLSFLETHPDQVASANVTNNAVCAKYEPGLNDYLRKSLTVGDPTDPEHDREWWALHRSPDFALLSHLWMQKLHLSGQFPEDREPHPTREGEAVSINFIAMKYPVLKKAASLMEDGGRLGDEGTIDSLLPWIVPNFRAAHLTFGPQEHTLTVDEIESLRTIYRKASA